MSEPQETTMLNGKKMPFNAEELKNVLKAIKKSFSQIMEKMLNEGEEEECDSLLNNI